MLGWTDSLTKSERALQNGNEEYEEWVWSGQMCSNVFWPVFCMDKSISTHSLSHTCTQTQVSQPVYLSLFLYVTLWWRTVSFSLLYKSVSLPFIACSHSHVDALACACIHTHTCTHTLTHTQSLFTWQET